MEETMLTTVDNPYNPFVQFDEWFAFDQQKGYRTTEYVARIANTSIELSDADYIAEVNDALDEILFFDVFGIYRKVTKENFDEVMSREKSEEEKSALEMLSASNDEEIKEQTEEESQKNQDSDEKE